MKHVWPFIVRQIGGVHMFGRLWIVIHDHGLSVAWKQIEKIDWRIK